MCYNSPRGVLWPSLTLSLCVYGSITHGPAHREHSHPSTFSRFPVHSLPTSMRVPRHIHDCNGHTAPTGQLFVLHLFPPLILFLSLSLSLLYVCSLGFEDGCGEGTTFSAKDCSSGTLHTLGKCSTTELCP